MSQLFLLDLSSTRPLEEAVCMHHWLLTELCGPVAHSINPRAKAMFTHQHCCSHIPAQLCHPGGPHSGLYRPATPSLGRQVPGQVHGGEGDPIPDPLLA
mmetsp:Transcript_6091/g.10977  ORF Transcript_6091/g.10977 Transcript_6091/m.10977 type:complete len:99 (+) Transcript_6091:50-346(+)